MTLQRVAVAEEKAITSEALLAALADYFEDAYGRTSDPGVEGQLWNDQGILMFSQGGGGYTPSLRFSDRRNSQYVGVLV